jgi:hypothetical protein
VSLTVTVQTVDAVAPRVRDAGTQASVVSVDRASSSAPMSGTPIERLWPSMSVVPLEPSTAPALIVGEPTSSW